MTPLTWNRGEPPPQHPSLLHCVQVITTTTNELDWDVHKTSSSSYFWIVRSLNSIIKCDVDGIDQQHHLHHYPDAGRDHCHGNIQVFALIYSPDLFLCSGLPLHFTAAVDEQTAS